MGLVLAVGLGFATGCGSSPQLGGDECLSAADALWTAVTSRRTELLDQALSNCRTLRDQGNLSEAAFTELTAVGDAARGGDWERAAARLKKLIQAQRRETIRTSSG